MPPSTTTHLAAVPDAMRADRSAVRPEVEPAVPVRPRSAGRSEPLLRHLIGALLRARREEQARTLRDVAESARVSVAYLSEVERGRKEVSSEVLVAVCRALGLRLVDLVGAAHAELALTDGHVLVDLTGASLVGSRGSATSVTATPGDPGRAVLLAA